MKSTLGDMIRRNAQWYGDQPAFEYGTESLTHAQFYEQSEHLARALATAGVKQQDRVAILSMNCLRYFLVYGACELSGYITSTVNFRLAPPEILHILRSSSPKVLFLEADFVETIDQIRSELDFIDQYVLLDGELPEWALSWEQFLQNADVTEIPTAAEDDTCYLIYTSGTTGQPKGCMLGHHAETTMAATLATCMGVGAHDKTLLMMPLFHIGAKAIALAQQWVGGSVVLHRVFDPAETLSTISNKKVTATHMAPTLIQALLEVPDIDAYDVSSLRMLIYSAAAMPPSLLKSAMSRFGPIFLQMYGQTEGIATMLPISAHVLSDDPGIQRRLVSVGHPFIGMDISIRDDDNQELPTDDVGEICIRGDMVMQGYWNNMQATLDTLRGGWLHTGDVGKIDEDGYVHLVDRKKDVIISGGENIYSREVEDAILLHPAVFQAAVIPRADEKWGESVCAVVSLRDDQSLSAEDLIAHCADQIARYKRPKSVIFVDELPIFPNGKINKKALREQYSAS